MKHQTFLLLFILFLSSHLIVRGQKALPGITVKGYPGRVIISWLNNYPDPVSNISIQRSYDSTRNFITIGSVLNPMNRENGYSDGNAPYNRMFYRAFVSFEGGKYMYSEVSRPDRSTYIQNPEKVRYSWQYQPPSVDSVKNPVPDIAVPAIPVIAGKKADTSGIWTEAEIKNKETAISPSRNVFSNRENNIVINLPDAEKRQYSLAIFDESGNKTIHIDRIRETYLIIEKVNFIHSGWFYFELYDGPSLLEKNRIFIPRDTKAQDPGRNGKNS